MSKMPLIIAAVSAVAFAVIFLGVYLPLTKPALTETAAGTVISRVLQTGQALGKVGYAMNAGNQVQVGPQYLIDVRLDSGELLRGTWPAPQIDVLPVGARVNVRLQRRVLLLFWKRTLVEDIALIAPGAGAT